MPDENTKYESFSKNPSFISTRGDTGYGNTSSGNIMGKRNNFSLARGFAASPIISHTYTIALSRTAYEEYSGDNLDYTEYRRNFIPDGSAGPNYEKVRDKNLPPNDIGTGGKPATPYTPNVSSPSISEGSHFIGPIQITKKTIGLTDIQLIKLQDVNLNPITSVNVDAENLSNNVGKVRRFKLGIGSNNPYTRS
jgi:hypothetical protein